MIYADNAATTRLDPAALEAMMPWLSEQYGNASQTYTFSCRPRQAIEEARMTVASCIGADASEIYFTSGGSESDNWVIKACASADAGRDLTVTSAFEHHAVLNACRAVERFGRPVIYLRPDGDGYVTADALAAACDNQSPRLVSVMTANNELGTLQPIGSLCETAHRYGALFHTDAVQAVGHVPIDAHALGVDFLSASAHKFNGPKGIGFLYIRSGIGLPPLIDGGAQESGYRAGTENTAAIVGMAAALKRNCEDMEINRSKLLKLERLLLARLDRSGVSYRRNGGNDRLPGFLSLSFPGKDGEAIMHRLDLSDICVSTGAACDSRETEVSHVLRAIRLEDSYAYGTVRISLGKYNTEAEVERIAGKLAGMDDLIMLRC